MKEFVKIAYSRFLYFQKISSCIHEVYFMKFLWRILATTHFVPGSSKNFYRRPKKQKFAASLTFLKEYDKHGNGILDRIVTGDEARMKCINYEMKRQSMRWGCTSSPKKPRKCLQTMSSMETVFWNTNAVILVDFLERGSTVNSESYETLLKLR